METKICVRSEGGGVSRHVSPSWIDVTHIGAPCSNAVPNDGVDDGPAIQCALERLSSTGGVVHIPAGTFHVASNQTYTTPTGASVATGLIVREKVKLQGDGPASVLVQSAAVASHLVIMLARSSLEGLQLQQEQSETPSGWAPLTNEFQVRVAYDDVTIRDLLLLNPSLGIKIKGFTDGESVGRTLVQNLRGQPLTRGILIDGALDVVRVEDVHFGPFWSPSVPSLRDAIASWTVSKSIAIESLRSEAPFFSKIVAVGYETGIRFGRSPTTCTANCGVTSRPKISAFECDRCGHGVLVDADNVRGVQVDQMSFQGSYAVGLGIFVNANNASLLLNRADFSHLGANAVRVRGTNTTVSVANTFVRDWACTGAPFPAFELAGGPSNNPGTQIRVTTTWAGVSQGPNCRNPNTGNICSAGMVGACDVLASNTEAD